MNKSEKYFFIGIFMMVIPFMGFVVWSYWVNVDFTPPELERYDMQGEMVLVITPMLGANDCGKNICDITRQVETDESQKEAIQRFLKLRTGMVTDLDIINNTRMISFHKTIILLDNTHVTQEIYDALKKHSNVIYLYPNALSHIVKVEDMKMSILSGADKEYPDCEGWDLEAFACRPTKDTWRDKTIFDYIKSKS